MTSRRLFNYLGAKRFIADKVNKILQHWPHQELLWVEPFCGGASLFYNLDVPQLQKKGLWGQLNDLDQNVMDMHYACLMNSYDKYIQMVKQVRSRFGDCRNSKEAYYDFRSWWNSESKALNPDQRGLYLIYLSSMCINSMLRFGPHGMNQGWGNRESVIDEADWVEMSSRLERASLHCGSYDELQFEDRSVVFLDPPYEAQKNDLYGKGFSQDEFLQWLLQKRREKKGCLWLYTDVETEKADMLLSEGFKKIPLREMTTTAPSKKKGALTSKEVMYVGLSCSSKENK